MVEMTYNIFHNESDLTFSTSFCIIMLPVEKNRLHAVWLSGYDLDKPYILWFFYKRPFNASAVRGVFLL